MFCPKNGGPLSLSLSLFLLRGRAERQSFFEIILLPSHRAYGLKSKRGIPITIYFCPCDGGWTISKKCWRSACPLRTRKVVLHPLGPAPGPAHGPGSGPDSWAWDWVQPMCLGPDPGPRSGPWAQNWKKQNPKCKNIHFEVLGASGMLGWIRLGDLL